MSNIRKLSAFRQLSLNSTERRRKTLKKQFSEDLPDNNWFDGRSFDFRPPPIKIAWEDESELKTEEAVIIKRCKEVRRASTGKLSRQSSLEKDSILHSKQEITERLRQHVENKEKEQEKRNLKIFLGHTSVEHKETLYQTEKQPPTPKLIQPLITKPTNTKNMFKIHRNRHKIDLHEIAYSPTSSPTPEEIKPIDSVIIRPTTAASKREKFQKRSNSAFTTPIRESPARPVMARSSSATVRPEQNNGKSKFVATRRKIRSAKRSTKAVREADGAIEGNPGIAACGAEIVTMVSLISPAGSDGEGEAAEATPTREAKKSRGNGRAKEETGEVQVQRNVGVALRKAVKSVSFQQSTIHAVRSFSASFPSRRSSMATAVMLVNDAKKTVSTRSPPPPQQEKIITKATPDDDDDNVERVPKARLVRSATTDRIDNYNPDLPESPTSPQLTDEDDKPSSPLNFIVDIRTKNSSSEGSEVSISKSPEVELENPGKTPPERAKQVKHESPKEKQCWDLHRKMTEKGINVSLDTILRGMLTPTEYRLSRQNSLSAAVEVEETDPDDVAL